MTALIALLLKSIGVGFLIVAGVGVIRFSDAFQRMHAATKAGTLGAGLVVAGTMVSHGTTDATVIGVLTIAFLLLTVPVAGHLLGRASYVSGATMTGLKGEDALNGVLERRPYPLEDRIVGLSPQLLSGDEHDTAQDASAALSTHAFPNLSEVKVGVIYGHVETVGPRALEIARANRAHISAHVIIDAAAIHTARDPKATRAAIRERAAGAMQSLETIRAKYPIKMDIKYDEGDPRDLLANDGRDGSLLVLPREGWFHHGNNDPRPGMSWEPDGLLHLPYCHGGPVLFSGQRDESSARIVVYDRGEQHLPALTEWALLSGLWIAREVVVVGCGREREPQYQSAGDHHDVHVSFLAQPMSQAALLPLTLADADAIVLGSLDKPLRTKWYGHSWYDRLIPGYEGDIVVACP